MINVDFLIPYPELEEKVDRVFQEHPMGHMLHNRVHSISAAHCDTFTPEGDVVIARGTTTVELRKCGLNVPIVEIPISTHDVLYALQRTMQRYHPERVALVGPFGDEYEAMNLSEVFGCEIRCFPTYDIANIDKTIEAAIDWGCDVINGSYTVHLRAVAYRISSLIVEVSDQAITQAFTEAVQAVERLRGEREKREMTMAILSSAKDGFVVVDRNRMITQINHLAKAAYRGERQGLIGCRLEQVFPYLSADVELAISGKETIGRQHRGDGGVLYITTCLPVVVDGQVSSVVIHMNNTSSQPAAESSRRRNSRSGLSAKYHFTDIIYQSPIMVRVMELARRYAEVSTNVLITGETGTGKELLAQSIHNSSVRRTAPFVAVNCATLPENLFESELFGYVEGAFTGTVKGGKVGLFEQAHGGTLFLDEISEIPYSFQSKLLRVLQEREIRRIGDDSVIPVDVRIVASTNQNLARMVERGEFRQDLYYRLNTLQLTLPPLRGRKEDLVTLFLHFVDRYNQRFGGVITEFSQPALELLRDHTFPGNVRELINVVERLSVNCKGMEYIGEAEMRPALFPGEELEGLGGEEPVEMSAPILRIRESEEERVRRVLRECGFNQTKAAKILGINRTTLWRKLQRMNPAET